MLKKIKNISLAEFLENEEVNKDLFEKIPALKRCIEGIKAIAQINGAKTAVTVWYNFVEKLPYGIPDLLYIIKE